MSVETPEETLSDDTREQLLEAAHAIEDATFDDLAAKPVRVTSFIVHISKDGRPRPARITYRALPPKAYDKLVADHPPSKTAIRERNATWDDDTFPPALIAAVSFKPKLTEEQARALLESPNWSAGEGNSLFFNAVNVCQAGLDVPFSAGD